MKNCHESQKLNSLIGKFVKIKFFDNTEYTGYLGKKTVSRNYKFKTFYFIENLKEINNCLKIKFYKSHVISIKEIK